MKIIRKTILDKLWDAINKHDDILRIELTTHEFMKAYREIIENKESYMHYQIKNVNVGCDMNADISGSYFTMKGVCIQTHIDYNDQ